MFYVIGLGNPGKKYTGTRHNVGRDVLIDLASEAAAPSWESDKHAQAKITSITVGNASLQLVLPETFMNKSGETARFLRDKEAASPDTVIVVYDDVDLPFGEIKISVGRGAGGHNGVASVIKVLGKDFIRIRVGIASTSFWTGQPKRPTGAGMSRHVLGTFSRLERRKMPEVGRLVTEAIKMIVSKGTESAMNRFN